MSTITMPRPPTHLDARAIRETLTTAGREFRKAGHDLERMACALAKGQWEAATGISDRALEGISSALERLKLIGGEDVDQADVPA